MATEVLLNAFLHKLLAGRILDRVDAAALLRANRSLLDFDYLMRWSGRLSLTAVLAEVWNDAFPTEPFPVESHPEIP